ncbi:MAG: hypothetical protein KIY10_10790 [Thermoplasmata archaeon]|nr:hypothetical protein [Candidatus Sysuiplasma jiujiangense]
MNEAIEALRGIYLFGVISNGQTVRQWGPLKKENMKLVNDIGLEELIHSY